MKCVECKYYSDFGEDKHGLPIERGECKRYAPSNTDARGNASWPIVEAWDFCGEYVAREKSDEVG